jgi:hypothetical protein
MSLIFSCLSSKSTFLASWKHWYGNCSNGTSSAFFNPDRRRAARRRRDPTGCTCSLRSNRRSCFLFSTVWGSRVPHFCMKSGMACVSFGKVSVVSSEGGGVGGEGVDDGVCNSARAIVEVERKRRGVPLAVGSCRTHLRHVVNCRSDGVTGAMAISDGGDERHSTMRGQNVDAGWSVRRNPTLRNLRSDCTTLPGMASTRISAPIRGVTSQLGRLSIRQDALTARCNVCCVSTISHASF